MSTKPIRIGDTEFHPLEKPVEGGCLTLDEDSFQRIVNYDSMTPFLMTVVSDADPWMFVSSTGGLTAGRGDPDHALFPYTTDDKLHDAAATTGGQSLLFVERGGEEFFWSPFSACRNGLYRLQRNLYKNSAGNKLIFEEINRDLGLVLRCMWTPTRTHGFVRRCTLHNHGRSPLWIRMLDGVRNLMPSGIDSEFQMRRSTLADAYKRHELNSRTRLGLFSLSSVPTDRAEPSEALRATTAWQTGLPDVRVLLCERQVAAFGQGKPVRQETDIRGMRGAYYVNAEFALPAQEQQEWFIVADIDQDTADVGDLNATLTETVDSELRNQIRQEVEAGTRRLQHLVALADGWQHTADELRCRRHFSNVLFNIMRGGVFDQGYGIEMYDLNEFVRAANRPLHGRIQPRLAKLEESLTLEQLLAWAERQNEPELAKLCREYLPLTFSRRHGDPSRPWNRFTIKALDKDGTRNRDYEGNWRDIFQNWEALSLSFPDFVENMVCKFVNASTLDGYNPFRITRNGFEWEVLDPDDPWSNIGYWGDHQIVYLTRLLEISRNCHPNRLEHMMTREIFAYADVPYNIKPYADLLADPRDTIEFDSARHDAIKQRVNTLGTDGRFARDATGAMHQVNLAEKLLVPILAKLGNWIPEGGIWMNTQRPEWNDANNALVGAGLSMVTLFHLRRHLEVCRDLFAAAEPPLTMTSEVCRAFREMSAALTDLAPLFDRPQSPAERRQCLDAFAQAHETLRLQVYAHGIAGTREAVAPQELVTFCTQVLGAVDHSLQSSRRPDGLVHSYNLMRLNSECGIEVEHLQEMLEGQVAALASGTLTLEECADLVDATRNSPLHRADQQSFVLYPDRAPPSFLEKNTIPADNAVTIELLRQLLADGEHSLIVPDRQGNLHFSGDLRNARALNQALDDLAGNGYADLVTADRETVQHLYEATFRHSSFTGRSGTMYKYEGLGCIYWHMVAKFALAVQESLIQAVETGASTSLIDKLEAHYQHICAGIGVHKSPAEYGAFPTDPYSHTPSFAGVQQPGMTGQVKEDILRRFRELGVRIDSGRLSFRPHLLTADEIPAVELDWPFVDARGESRILELPPAALAFSLCQVPVILHHREFQTITIHKADGTSETIDGDTLTLEHTQAVFGRTGEIIQLDVQTPLATP